ncbi:MAG: response regulator transcription factor [Ferruginibacter sp.]
MIQSAPHLLMLAIDDETSIQLILQHYFRADFLVITKGNGKEALDWMQQGNIPDIIVADINMPEMDGYTFIDQVRSSGFLQNIPMVMLSGSDSTDNKIRCLESGADDFMVKPFNPRELAARVNGILRRSGKKQLHNILQ